MADLENMGRVIELEDDEFDDEEQSILGEIGLPTNLSTYLSMPMEDVIAAYHKVENNLMYGEIEDSDVTPRGYVMIGILNTFAKM